MKKYTLAELLGQIPSVKCKIKAEFKLLCISSDLQVKDNSPLWMGSLLGE